MNILSKMTENRFYLTTNSIFSLMNFSHIKEFQVLSFFSYCPYFLDDPPPPHEPSLSDNLSDREFLERIVRIWNYLLNGVLRNTEKQCFWKQLRLSLVHREAVVQRYSVEKVFLEISENSQEGTSARISFL